MKASVFFGGGAFIALHAGYTKGPLASVSPDRVYGVSAGSLWATVLAFLGVDKGIEILGTLKQTSDVFAQKDVIADFGDTIGRRWASIPTGFGYGPLHSLLTKYITGKPTIPVTISAVSLENGRHVHFTAWPDGTFTQDDITLGTVSTLSDFLLMVLASCSTYPLVDAVLDSKNQGWIDGGFREGGPVEAALKDGATELHLCLTGNYSEDCGFSGNANDVFSGITRAMEIMANQNVITAVNAALEEPKAVTYVYAAKGQGSSQVFNQTDIQANILIGEKTVAVPGSTFLVLD
jgi:predicted acylesterase/phospholipase RssA